MFEYISNHSLLGMVEMTADMAKRFASIDDSLRSMRLYSVVGTVAQVLLCAALVVAVFMLAEEARRTLRAIRTTAAVASETAATINDAVGGAADGASAAITQVQGVMRAMNPILVQQGQAVSAGRRSAAAAQRTGARVQHGVASAQESARRAERISNARPSVPSASVPPSADAGQPGFPSQPRRSFA